MVSCTRKKDRSELVGINTMVNATVTQICMVRTHEFSSLADTDVLKEAVTIMTKLAVAFSDGRIKKDDLFVERDKLMAERLGTTKWEAKATGQPTKQKGKSSSAAGSPAKKKEGRGGDCHGGCRSEGGGEQEGRPAAEEEVESHEVQEEGCEESGA